MDKYGDFFKEYIYRRKISIVEANKLKYDIIPKSLYRYRKLDENNLDSLKKQIIYMSSPNDFNDILDCKYVFLEKNKDISNYSQNEYILNKINEEIKIACFSESKDSKTMWAHYADQGNGFCVEYNFKSIDPNGESPLTTSLFPVLYREEKLDITENISRLDVCDIELIAGLKNVYKNVDWSYEREWRLILTKENCNELKLTPIAIHLGYKCSELYKELLKKPEELEQLDKEYESLLEEFKILEKPEELEKITELAKKGKFEILEKLEKLKKMKELKELENIARYTGLKIEYFPEFDYNSRN